MFIQELVGILFRKLNHTYSCVSEDLVGMDSSMEETIKLLGLGMDDARVVGIWGMGGIAKTTLASAIYAHISCQFEDYSFIENVREVSEKGGLKTLHEQLISKILMEKDLKVGNIGSALSTIRNRVCRKKVHIVLDDVDESTELEKLVGELDWFGFGREDEAIELFKSKAFRKHQQMGGYGELVHCAIKYAKGVPLALKESPKEPRQRSRFWLYEDSTHVLVKNMGTKKVEGIVVEYPDLSRDPMGIVLKLRPKAFAKMSNLRILKICCMHLSEDLKYLSNKLRYLDWCRYPMKCMPSSFQPAHLVELHLTYSSIEQLWEGTMYPDFTTFPNLERLILEGCTYLVNLDPSIGILRRLICLNLKDCKILKSLPSDIQLETIEVLNVSGCSKVENISVNFGYMKCLSELDLDGIGVSELPPSIGHLANLVLLSLSNSKKLRSIPNNICQLKALSSLNVSGCSKLDKLPQYMGALDCLKDLHLDQTAIRQLPSSIGLLKKLKTLSLEGCKGIASYSWSYSFLPSILQRRRESYTTLELEALLGLESLERLHLNDCNLKSIPITIFHIYLLRSLDISGNNIESLPESLNKLSNLGCLYLNGCKRLQELPELSSNINNIEANDCTSLRTILSMSKYDNVEGFSFMNCFKLAENEQNNILSEKVSFKSISGSLDILNGNGNTLLIFVSPRVRFQSGSVIKVGAIHYLLNCLHIVIMTASWELFLLLLESRMNPSAASAILLRLGLRAPGIQMTSGESNKNELAYFQYLNARNVAVIYVPLNGIPGLMEDDMGQLNEGGIEFQACLVREGHDFDDLTKAFDEDFSLIEGDVKLGVHLVYKEEADEEVWRIIDSSDTEDNNMSVFHGDLDRSVGRAGVEVASFSATTSKRRRGDLNDNHYNVAVGSSGCGKFDDQEEEDNLNSKRLKQAGPSECGNFD
ncbi:hypothetical protein ACSBR2_012462 [Camellia fascicularis]